VGCKGVVTALVTAVACLLWVGHGVGQPSSLGKITLGLAVSDTFEYLPAHAAEDLGTWKKRGLDVTIVAFPGLDKRFLPVQWRR
jgi:ABC-type nitrate/sulfonate/bicarbonate transport system substrate-binding protein